MKIALFGGAGTLGSRIAAEARSRGHSVTSLSRSGTPPADARDAASVAAAVAGHDAVISAIGPRHGDEPSELSAAARGLLAGVKQAGVKRLLVVGGAGSLEVAPGKRLVDAPDFPAGWKGVALAHADALAVVRANTDVDWTYASPAALIQPGQRTGKYRTGGDQLLTDEKGQSHISAEDFAVALIDELEKPRFVRKRFTAAD